MTDKSSSLVGPNVNFLFHSVERDMSNSKGLSETDKIYSEFTQWRNIPNGTASVDNHVRGSYNDTMEDWNEKFRNYNSSSSLSSSSDLFQQGTRAVENSLFQWSSCGRSLEHLSLNKFENSELERTDYKEMNQISSPSLVPKMHSSHDFSNLGELFSDWTCSSDSSETQASQASRGTVATDLTGNESSQVNSLQVYPLRQSRPDCVYYLKTGKCSYGTKCKYNHPPRDQTLVKALSRRECFDFLQFGKCPYGKRCKYNHPNRKQMEKRVACNDSVAAEPTRNCSVTQKNSDSKNYVDHRKRLPSNPDALSLKSSQVASMCNKEKENSLHYEQGYNLTSYHLWDSISMFEYSLPSCGPTVPSNRRLNTLNEGDPNRCIFSNNSPFGDITATLQRRQNSGPRRASRDFSCFEDYINGVPNDTDHSSQFFSTPSVELSDLNKLRFESGERTMAAHKTSAPSYETKGQCFNEESCDYLVTLFPSCSTDRLEPFSMNRRKYSYQFLG
ncbi:hypothetical protein GAYE_PCTG36G0966 [Galdieria yellowstonensis]|uniref:C3H1-type domain-containing protein n=1 Tax=Galdieria yellowstonensis TaxID=3028027 RepID=A0AAV9I3N8_9RHOD|nr:hypothetical protein GAYE_PCTG36G0966 [Galdieria yellowstonensis]